MKSTIGVFINLSIKSIQIHKLINILLITDKLKYVCGVSNHLKNLVNGFYSYDKNFKFVILCGDAESIELVREYKCKVIVNSKVLHSNRSVFNFVSSLFLVMSIIKKHDINIIHSHNHYAANLASYSNRFTKIVSVQTNHGIIPNKGRMKHYKSDYHVVLSSRLKNLLVKKEKIKPERIFILKNGIYNEKMEVDKPINEKLIVLAASRFDKDKRLDLFVEAANILGGKHIGTCEFILSGAGSEKYNLLNLNESLGGIIKFIDPISEYKSVLSKSNIFVFTSRENEGIPTVIIEALFNNCLVISSSYEGYKDIFQSEYTDLIFKSNNLEDLLEKIDYAIRNYSSLIKAYRPLYERIISEYTIDKMVYNYINLYQKILTV